MTAEQPDGVTREGLVGDDEPSRALSLLTALAALTGLASTVVWAAAGGGAFWAGWVWLGLGTVLALVFCWRQAARSPAGRRRWLVLDASVSGVLCVNALFNWVLGGAGTFWPIWPWIGFALLLALHVLYVYQDRLPPHARERELTDRVDVLTRTRRGALDVQAAELRRIERDLHDGAQARLVALTMQLGRAEARLDGQPEVAALVRGARDEASAAIRELRDLARGIAPPVLADRGLAAAVEGIAGRSLTPVTITSELDRRRLPVVETAAYFVVAEALTNVAKHAPGASARITIREHDDRLVVEVADDGPGGADPAGSGLSGLRARVEALDGTLTITAVAPPGSGTSVRAELPCGS